MKTVKCIAVAALALAGCGGIGGDGVVTFSLPHVLNTEHPVHQALEVFADEVAKRSNATMIVKIFPGGTMGSEQELADNVATGTNDFTKISSTILETKSELAKIYSLPYLFRDAGHMWNVLDGPIGVELLDLARDKGLKGICYFDAGFRSFYLHRAATGAAEELRGKKIRVQKSEMMDALVASLGALPQQIDYSELYTSLDTGVVDGAENNLPSYYTSRHYDVAPYYIFDEHVAAPDILVMNDERWNSLTPEQQQIIREAADVAKAFQRDLWETKSAEYIDVMKEAGVTFLRPEKQPFIDATKSVYDRFEGTKVMDFVTRIQAE